MCVWKHPTTIPLMKNWIIYGDLTYVSVNASLRHRWLVLWCFSCNWALALLSTIGKSVDKAIYNRCVLQSHIRRTQSFAKDFPWIATNAAWMAWMKVPGQRDTANACVFTSFLVAIGLQQGLSFIIKTHTRRTHAFSMNCPNGTSVTIRLYVIYRSLTTSVSCRLNGQIIISLTNTGISLKNTHKRGSL